MCTRKKDVEKLSCGFEGEVVSLLKYGNKAPLAIYL